MGWKAAATDGAGGIPDATCGCGMMYIGGVGPTIVCCLLLGNCDIMAACGCGIAKMNTSLQDDLRVHKNSSPIIWLTPSK